MPCDRQLLLVLHTAQLALLQRPAPVAAAPDRVKDVDADARAVQGVVVLPIQRQVRMIEAVQVPGRVLLHVHQRRLLHLHLLGRVQRLHLGVLAQRTLLRRVQLRGRPAQLAWGPSLQQAAIKMFSLPARTAAAAPWNTWKYLCVHSS